MSEFIPIDTIEPDDSEDGSVVPTALVDDPFTGDGSAGREGVKMHAWRVHTLKGDRLHSISEPSGNDRRSRKARRARAASQRSRGKRVRVTRRRARTLIGVLVVAAIAALAYVGITYALEFWGGHTVPNVVGVSELNATEQLQSHGFAVDVQRVPADEIDGHVIAMDPAAGDRVDVGATVTLSVSQGRHIPEVVGLTRAEAQAALKDAGASNVRIRSLFQFDEEDKVVEVQPPAGSAFVSTDEVTLVISQLPSVPSIVGLTEYEARVALEREGIPATMVFEAAGVENRLLVVRTTPEAGQSVGVEGVVAYLGDPLVEVTRLSDYFDASAAHVNEFLQAHGFTPKLGYRNAEGRLVSSYTDIYGARISFMVDPWSQSTARDQTPYTEVMDEGTHVEGVRLSIAPANATVTDYSTAEEAQALLASSALFDVGSATVGEATARDVMARCGFDNLVGACTQTDITLPKGRANSGHVFYCCYGTMGSEVWTVLVRGSAATGSAATEVVATCMPHAAYEALDLSPFDGSICDFVAYQDEYVG